MEVGGSGVSGHLAQLRVEMEHNAEHGPVTILHQIMVVSSVQKMNLTLSSAAWITVLFAKISLSLTMS